MKGGKEEEKKREHGLGVKGVGWMERKEGKRGAEREGEREREREI